MRCMALYAAQVLQRPLFELLGTSSCDVLVCDCDAFQLRLVPHLLSPRVERCIRAGRGALRASIVVCCVLQARLQCRDRFVGAYRLEIIAAGGCRVPALRPTLGSCAIMASFPCSPKCRSILFAL